MSYTPPGAGDLYAAGFLYGSPTGYEPESLRPDGRLCAAEVISHPGPVPRPTSGSWQTGRPVLIATPLDAPGRRGTAGQATEMLALTVATSDGRPPGPKIVAGQWPSSPEPGRGGR